MKANRKTVVLFAMVFAVAMLVVFKTQNMPLSVQETVIVLLIGFGLFYGGSALYSRITKSKDSNE